MLIERRALIIVDVQNDFCEGGSLAVPGGASVAHAISEYARTRATDYDVIVATRDWHVDPGHHFAGEGQDPDFAETWPVHCQAGTLGADFHPDLHLPGGTIVVSKGEHAAAYSGFEAHDDEGDTLDELLKAHNITDVDIVGIATSFCDKATALGSAQSGYRTRLLLSLCADVPGADTAATLQELKRAGVTVAK